MRSETKTRLAVIAVACAGVGGALAASGHAEEAGRTLTLSESGIRGALLDIAPKTVGRGQGSLGDAFTISGKVVSDAGAKGTFQATFTIGNRKPVPLPRAVGVITGAYHLPDGDLHVQARATFDDADVDHGAVIGGTGAYAGARGTLESDKKADVIRLLP